jgi:hypothetical protein
MTPVSISQLHANAPWWVFAIIVAGLALHIGGGSVSILSGYSAVFVRKGARLHRLFGSVFFVAMLVMGTMGLALSVWIRQFGNIAGGALATYLVATAWLTVKQKAGTTSRLDVALFVAVLATAGLLLYWGVLASLSPKHVFQGYGAALYYVFGSFAGLFAALDLRVILRGGIAGAARIARHLWRMCFALFFAAASFFLGQQKVMPAFMHGSPLLYIAALAPLGFLLFWLARTLLPKRRRSRVAEPRRPLGQPA